MPPAVALLNYISCGILWRIFCQTGIFAGFSLYIKLTINWLIKFKKLRDIIEGPWLQKDIKLPMSLCFWLFWPLNCPSLRSGQFKGSKKSWPPQNVPRNGSKSYCPAKKNDVPQFLKQRDINSYSILYCMIVWKIFSMIFWKQRVI